jgi:hypothetical protein
MADEQTTAVRNIIAEFVESLGADSVIVLWSENVRDGTRAKVASWGNQLACRDMIKSANDDYCVARIDEITKRNPKKKENG